MISKIVYRVVNKRTEEYEDKEKYQINKYLVKYELIDADVE
jgi:hypothetical protein